MARRVTTQLVSDLSGNEIKDGEGETIEFSYRGASYRIDLSAREAAFDKSIATISRTRRGLAASAGPPSRPPPTVTPRPAASGREPKGWTSRVAVLSRPRCTHSTKPRLDPRGRRRPRGSWPHNYLRCDGHRRLREHEPGSFTGPRRDQRVEARKCLPSRGNLGLQRLKFSSVEGTP